MGIAIFIILDKGLKIVFSAEVFSSISFLSYLARALRYAVSSFVVISLYPMLFNKVDKLIKDKNFSFLAEK